MAFDPRTISAPVYQALSDLRQEQNRNAERLKEQKNQAVEIYTYLATWGMMRLKAEEQALSQEGKKEVVRKFFTCLETISGHENLSLNELKGMSAEKYLGLTGLGLALAQEFSFWATAVYHDIKGAD
jgi:transcription elongation factor GreA-like protein